MSGMDPERGELDLAWLEAPCLCGHPRHDHEGDGRCCTWAEGDEHPCSCDLFRLELA